MSVDTVKVYEDTARERFIEDNLGLVHACAGRFRGRGMEYDDLYQAGCLGLLKAYNGFDSTRGLQFSTYAVPVILGEIKKLFRDGGAVKVSRRLKELSLKARRMADDVVKHTGEEPAVSELADMLGCTVDTLVEATCAAQPVLSLTAAGEDSDPGAQWDLPVDSGEEQITERLSLLEAMTQLTEEERFILHERFYKSRTQAQVAQQLGSTQVRISRSERRIIEKLRECMR